MNITTKVITFGASPVPVATVYTPCCRIYVQPVKTNVADAYVGLATMVKATLVGVIKVLTLPSTTAGTLLDSWEIRDESGANTIDAGQIYLDGATGEKAIVTTFAR